MHKVKNIVLSLLRQLLKINLLEKLLLKFTTGRNNENFFVRLAPQNYHYKKESIRNVVRNNIHYRLDISEYIQWWVYYGIYEEEKINLYRLVAPGFSIMDIGTNIGEVAMNLASRVGAEGKIFCFEPDPLNYKKLLHNLSLNHFTNIHTYQMALGNDTAEHKLYAYEENRGCNRIMAAGITSNKNYSTIRTMPADQWSKENAVNKINLIKIDTEGYEMNVLLGAVETISRFRPVLYIELNDDNLKAQHSSAAELVNYVTKSGYRVISSATGKEVNASQNFLNCHYDIICNPL